MAFYNTSTQLEKGLKLSENAPDVVLAESPTASTGTNGALSESPLTQEERELLV